ncbi:OPT oligopeptide transporter protein-domain-containing protein [Hysterangium stoloniferum]|nr:OPT oligopeptide transporter protein-domain-containing protein [Hysterangium stoloniferum]
MTRHEHVAVGVDQLPHIRNKTSMVNSYFADEKNESGIDNVEVSGLERFNPEDRLYDDKGNEKVMETAKDFATALVSLEDGPTLPIHTFRMWFLGIGLAVFGSVLGMLFQFRPQVISVSALFLQLLAYMLGKVLEVTIPSPDIKEHVATQIMASTAAGTALACLVFASDDLFYNITVNSGNAIFTLLASQLLGYGIAGVFLYPTTMLYPRNLIYVNLFDVLHRSKGELLRSKRLSFFWIVVGAVGSLRSPSPYNALTFLPSPKYIAPLLGSFNIVCLAVRNSDWVTNVFGGSSANEGMGLLSFGLDWANITSAPFYKPLTTQIYTYVGWAMNYIILPLVYYRNVCREWDNLRPNIDIKSVNNPPSRIKPLMSTAGRRDFSLNRTAFEIVGQPWQSGPIVIRHLGINLSIGATFVHIGLWHGKEVGIDHSCESYKEVPRSAVASALSIIFTVPLWWYSSIAIGAFAVASSSANEGYSGLCLYRAFTVGKHVIVQTASWIPNMTSLFQIIGAALIPGSSQANMYFELYSSRGLTQAVAMLSDLKLGQYTKLPPRVTFIVQIVGTVVGALLNCTYIISDVIMQTIVDNERSILYTQININYGNS